MREEEKLGSQRGNLIDISDRSKADNIKGIFWTTGKYDAVALFKSADGKITVKMAIG